MALIQCPECATEVSETATRCPHCGVQLRKPKRTMMGKIIKWSFILFNIFMLVWFVGGMNEATQGIDAMSGAEQAGAVIGTGLGATMLLGIWCIGDFILGLFVLFTRPKNA